jgi:hypothetical protein
MIAIKSCCELNMMIYTSMWCVSLTEGAVCHVMVYELHLTFQRYKLPQNLITRGSYINPNLYSSFQISSYMMTGMISIGEWKYFIWRNRLVCYIDMIVDVLLYTTWEVCRGNSRVDLGPRKEIRTAGDVICQAHSSSHWIANTVVKILRAMKRQTLFAKISSSQGVNIKLSLGLTKYHAM